MKKFISGTIVFCLLFVIGNVCAEETYLKCKFNQRKSAGLETSWVKIKLLVTIMKEDEKIVMVRLDRGGEIFTTDKVSKTINGREYFKYFSLDENKIILHNDDETIEIRNDGKALHKANSYEGYGPGTCEAIDKIF